jgi:ribosomal protein L29
MRSRDIKQLKDTSVVELKKNLDTKRKELTNFRLEVRLRKQKNIRLGERLTDDIARILTILTIKGKEITK